MESVDKGILLRRADRLADQIVRAKRRRIAFDSEEQFLQLLDLPLAAMVSKKSRELCR